jgi:hypothetical protein
MNNDINAATSAHRNLMTTAFVEGLTRLALKGEKSLLSAVGLLMGAVFQSA